MIKITKDIINAIRFCLENDYKSEEIFAKKIGVRQATLNSWKNLAVKSIQQNSWEKLFPIIEKYLPKNSFTVSTKGKIQESIINSINSGNNFFKNTDNLSKEDFKILEWFNHPENQVDKYELLLKIAKRECQNDT